MSLVFIGIVPAEAEENGSYLCVPVEYSDNVNEIEELNVLVLDDNIYVDALQLAQRFGYDLSNNDDENIFERFRFDHLQHAEDPVIAGYMFNFKTLLQKAAYSVACGPLMNLAYISQTAHAA